MKLKITLFFLFLFILFLIGCDKKIFLPSPNFDCWGYHDEFVSRDWSYFQEQLDKDKLEELALLDLPLYFLSPDFQESLSIKICFDECSRVSCSYLKILTEGKKEDCFNLPSEITIPLCTRGGIMTGHALSCQNVSANYRETCYFLKSIQEKFSEKGSCEKIPPSLIRDECTTYQAELGGSYGTEEYCDRLTDSSNQLFCYREIAVANLQPEICEKSPERDQCYFYLATTWKNPDYCLKMDLVEEKDNCFYQLASQLKNPSLCEKIVQESGQKEICKDSASMKEG